MTERKKNPDLTTRFGGSRANRGHRLSQDEARRGGLKSVESRRRQKSFKEIADAIGVLAPSPAERKAIVAAGIDDEATRDIAVMLALSDRAKAGDLRAIELLAQVRGQLRQQISAEVAEVRPLIDLTKIHRNGDGAEVKADAKG